MDARTLEALKASIAKWERNAEVENVYDAKIFGNSCPLCKLFADNDECDGCPVSAKTGFGNCEDSPWPTAHMAFFKKDRMRFRKAARAEVAFLKSLLPEEAQ